MFSVRTLTNYEDRNSLGSRLRRKRAQPLMEIIDRVFLSKGKVEIIDLGGTVYYWEKLFPEDFLSSRHVHVTLVNLPGTNVDLQTDRYTVIFGDACNLQNFPDKSFDIVHSNSVVEHVGTWSNMKSFANEVRRLADTYFVQTPSFWFPVEPHCLTPFFHWLPLPWRLWLVMHFTLGHWPKSKTINEAAHMCESAQLLTYGMMAYLFPEAVINRERILLFTKSFIAISDPKAA